MDVRPDDPRDRRLGSPFPEGFPDRRSDRQRTRDSRLVRAQAAELAVASKRGGSREQVVDELMERRKGAGPEVVQFERCRTDGKDESYCVPGALLVKVMGDDRDDRARRMLTREGYRQAAVPCEELKGRIEQW